MELPQNDSHFKVWTSREDMPVSRYAQGFNGYEQKEEERLPEVIGNDAGYLSYAKYMLNNQIPIHTFLHLIVERSMVLETEEYSPFKTLFMDDEALILSIMLKRDGFLDTTGCDKPCVACATEKLEIEITDIMRRQMEILSLARKFYTQTENEEKYNICCNHRKPTHNSYFPSSDVSLQPPSSNSYNWLEESMQARRHNIDIIQRFIMQSQNNSLRYPFMFRQPNTMYNYANFNYAGYPANYDYYNQNNMQQQYFDPNYLQNYYDYFQNFNFIPEQNRSAPPLKSKYFPDQPRQLADSDILTNYIFVPVPPCDFSENSFNRPEIPNFNTDNNANIQNDPFSYPVNVTNGQNSNYSNNRIRVPPGFAPNNLPTNSINPPSNVYANQYMEENYLLNLANHNSAPQFQGNNGAMRNNTIGTNMNFQPANENASGRDKNKNAVKNTVNHITREFQQQLIGNRMGRKILGKRY